MKKTMTLIFLVIFLGILINQLFNLNDKYRLFQSNVKFNNLEKINVIYPSIGCPSEILSDSTGIFNSCFYLISDQLISINDLTANIVSVGRDSSYTNDCKILSIQKEKSDSQIGPGVLADWIQDKYGFVYKVNFKIVGPIKIGLRRNILLDLEVRFGNDKISKRGCFFISKPDSTKKILYATDIHISKRWDQISGGMIQVLPKRQLPTKLLISDIYTPNTEDVFSRNTFNSSFSNPNKNFIKFLQEANRMHREGEIDFIVLGGDLVDFKYNVYKSDCKNSFEESEWSIFLKILDGKYLNAEKLEVPIYTITGNHDYRLYPYRLQAYGLRHCGIPDELTEKYLKATKQLSKTKFVLDDLNSIRINDGENHSLGYYYQLINPFTSYSLDFINTKLVFLDSKSDAFCHIGNIISKRGIGILSSLEHPSSDGIDNVQIKFLKNNITSRKHVILFTHAPVLNNFNDTLDLSLAGQVQLPMIPIPTNPNNGETENFQLGLQKNGLSTSVLFQNQFKIIEALIDNNKSTVVFSGHNHRTQEYILGKKEGKLYSGRYTLQKNLGKLSIDDVLFIQTPSLGHLLRTEQVITEPGYRIIEFNTDGLVSAEYFALDEPPFDVTKSHIIFSKNQKIKTVEFHIEKGQVIKESKKVIFRLIVFNSPKRSTISLPLITSQDKNVNLLKKYSDKLNNNFWVFQTSQSIVRLNIKESEPNGQYLFAIETFLEDNGKIESLGLRLIHRKL